MLRSKHTRIKLFNRHTGLTLIVIIFIAIVASFLLPDFFSVKYDSRNLIANAGEAASSTVGAIEPKAPVITHVKIPASLKGVYMTSWVAGSKNIRGRVLDVIDNTEVNAVVIDIKDDTGKISFKTGDAKLDNSGCVENRISDIKELIQGLHDKGVYVIGRVAVFQDPCFVKLHPEAAVKRASDGAVWKDRKGLTWMDAGSKIVWDHAIQIAKASYAVGFDEINFDYIRFPSDGNMRDIAFPVSAGRPKAVVVGDFFRYLDKELRGGRAASTSDPVFEELYAEYASTSTKSEKTADLDGHGRMIISADLFGLVTVAQDDLGIGQTLDQTLPYVDFIAPMVYPSHFAKGWNGFANPAIHPYDTIKVSMGSAVGRARARNLNIQKLRPWLQDFDLGATYTADMVRAQIQATYDVGLTGWLMWDPSNKYTAGVFKKTLAELPRKQ